MRLPRKHRHARLELLSLMDVVFLILVFLIYAMMVMVVNMGMPVTLPSSRSSQPDQQITLAVTIQEDGELWVNKARTTLEDLPNEILRQSREEGFSETDEPIIQVFADALLPYQKLFELLDVLKQAGLKKISLQSKAGS